MRRARLALLAAVLVAACTETSVEPEPAGPLVVPPSAEAISDGANGGNPGFFWLPPLVESAAPTGTFNAGLAPQVDVCIVIGEDCGENPTVVADFPPGSAKALEDRYFLDWPTRAFDLERDVVYRIRARLGDEVLGFIDITPRCVYGPEIECDTDPNYEEKLENLVFFPLEVVDGVIVFPRDALVEIQFFIRRGISCDPNDPIVIECTEGTILDGEGGTIALSDQGPTIGVTVPADGLPDTDPVVTFTVERIQVPEGGRCIEGLDIPTFDAFCLRITTIPTTFESPIPANLPTVVTLCAEPTDLTPFLADPNSALNAQLFREPEGDGPIQGLANVASDLCGTPDPAPPDGPIGRLLWPVLRHIGPKPLYAIHRGRGGEVSEVFEFSTYTWGLPTQCVADSPRSQVGNAGAPVEEAPRVQCVDEAGLPVLNARIRSQVVDGNGTATPVVGFTDETGSYSLDTWVLGDQGSNSVELFGLGLFGEDEEGSPETFVPHEFTRDVGVGSVRFEAAAAGAPANLDPAGTTSLGEAEVGTTLPEPLVVTVLDDGGNSLEFLGVPGVTVTWTVTEGNGTLQQSPASDAVTVAETPTNDEGRTSVIFTLGTQAGNNTVTATVGDLSTSYTAVGVPGAPAQALVVSGDGQAGRAGQPLPDPIVLRVEDEFGNGVPGQEVSWSAGPGGGSFGPNPSTTDGDGLASTVWTLGDAAGVLEAQAEVLGISADLTAEFSAEIVCRPGTGTAVVDGVRDAEEWACANVSRDYVANLGGDAPTRLYWMNDADNLYLAVVVENADREYDLLVDFDNDDDGVAERGDDGFEYSIGDRQLYDRFLTAKCENRRQSGCGELDASRRNGGANDGAGAHLTSGNVTVYEFVKPLNSDDDAFDFSLVAPDQVGLFWTFRGPGKGAKGNSQIPGFREYLSIGIVPF